jgi:hypothetical protein
MKSGDGVYSTKVSKDIILELDTLFEGKSDAK